MLRSFLLLFLLVAAFSMKPHSAVRPHSTVTMSGSVTDCFTDSIVKVPGTSVSAFDASQNRELLDSLRAMDGLNFTDSSSVAMTRMGVQYDRVTSLVQNSTALARTTADSTGSFQFSIEPVDSIIVFGSYEAEDEPFPYAYKVVGAQVNTSIVLDMSRGSCSYITQ